MDKGTQRHGESGAARLPHLLERALAVDEMQEDLYYKIIGMYIDLGDRASATRVYRRCVSTFGESPPLADTQEVKSLLAQLS